jgi:hypothetical protein
VLRTSEGISYLPPPRERASADPADVYVVAEKQQPPAY